MRARCPLNHLSTVIILRSNPSSDFKVIQQYVAISFTQNTVGICQLYIVIENTTPTLALMRSPRRIVKKMILRSGGSTDALDGIIRAVIVHRMNIRTVLRFERAPRPRNTNWVQHEVNQPIGPPAYQRPGLRLNRVIDLPLGGNTLRRRFHITAAYNGIRELCEENHGR
ncbi:hypothetical protein M405DRAFT_846478 [Rhizopogon salebrosus TDB-379]|nr:hypothetical protein M405DRAFT_846478 [Rhizopogon salebrosus TDB-379]